MSAGGLRVSATSARTPRSLRPPTPHSPRGRAARWKQTAAKAARETYSAGTGWPGCAPRHDAPRRELAVTLGVSQAHVARIEQGDISGIDIIRAPVTALGGSIDLTVRGGDKSWKVT